MFTSRFEFNEKQQCFHEDFYFKGKTQHEPNTFGWVTVADHVETEDVSNFCYIIENATKIGWLPEKLDEKTVHMLWYVYKHSQLPRGKNLEEAMRLDQDRFE